MPPSSGCGTGWHDLGMLELIVFGLFYENDWDLTQPQAVLIVGFVSGFFLVGAAWLAFHGQKQNRIDERQRHEDLLTAQRDQHEAQLTAQREEWKAVQKAASDLKFRDEVRDVYLRALKNLDGILDAFLDFRLSAKCEDSDGQYKAVNRLSVLNVQWIELRGELALVSEPHIFDAVIGANALRMKLAEDSVEAVDAKASLPDFDSEASKQSKDELTALMRTHLDGLRPVAT
jgi:hypothetical protein